jgi:hypothetical protein
MEAFVVSDDDGNILGIYKSIEEVDKKFNLVNVDKFSHPTLSFEEFVSLQQTGIQ